MANRSAFKFCVGTEDTQRSSIWSVAVNKNDVYLTSSLFNKTSKLSLHESGRCHFRLTSQYLEAKKIHQGQYDYPRWYFDNNTQQPQIVFVIIFPFAELINFSDDIGNEKRLERLPQCCLGEFSEVVVYKITDMNDGMTIHPPSNYNIFKIITLKNGSGLFFMYCHRKLQPEHEKTLDQFKSEMVTGKKDAGIPDDRMIGGYCLFNYPENICRICECYC